jgi:hypothetical protein
MQVKIFDVRIPDTTTRFFQVPAYDIPILRKLWRARLKPDYLGNMPVIEVYDQGVVEGRSLYNERLRIRRDYGTNPDGDPRPAWQSVYSTDEAFDAAYNQALADCAADLEKRTRPVAPKAPVAEEDEELVGASTASGDLFKPGKKK